MRPRIVITGMGAISAAGRGIDATREALLAGRSGLGPLTRFRSPRCGGLPVAEVRGVPDEPGVPRIVSLGRIALVEALVAAGVGAALRGRTAIAVGTCVGGMPESEAALEDVLAGRPLDESVWLRHECGSSTDALARHAGLGGPALTVSTACSSGAQALACGVELLLSGEADLVAAGGVDAICRLTLNGFASLLAVDPEGCRPFDRRRKGMSLGEGAAFLVLETEEHARSRGARPRAVLAGCGNSCDAHHPTAPEPSGRGAEAALRAALDEAGIDPAQVDHVNAHGTGTSENDRAEGIMLARVFGERGPAVSSTKRVFGHALGAAGALEAVATVLALEDGFLPGTAGLMEPDPACAIAPLLGSRRAAPRVALSSSFGFGGNNTVLCLARWDGERAAGPGAGSAPPPGARTPEPHLSDSISTVYPVAESRATTPRPATVGLCVRSYAIAGEGSALVPEGRRCPLPAKGPHPRSARLPDLATALARRALEGAPPLPETASVLFGTALGCVTETASFLENMIRQDEATPLPRAFAASVHNAVASRVALALGARGECQTFVHGEVSFAQALFAAVRRRARGEAGPAVVGAADESHPLVARARRALGCPDVEADAEGGAVLVCGDSGGGPPLALVRLVSFGRPGDPAAWLARRLESAPAEVLFLDLPEGAEGVRAACEGRPTVEVRRLVGGHPSSAAVATALAVAVLAGESVAGAPLLCSVPRSIGVLTATRSGDVGLMVLSRADG